MSGGNGAGQRRSGRPRRRSSRWSQVAGGSVLALLWLALPVGPAAHAVSSVSSVSSVTAPLLNVTCANDPKVDTPALQGAISKAQKVGATVAIAAGTCALNARLVASAAVTIDGTGPTSTFLVQHAASNIFQITGRGVTVENLNLDTAMFNASLPTVKNPNPAVLYSNASQTTVTGVTAEAGSGFGMRFVGPSPCSTDQNDGDSISNIDITTTGTGGFAAIDVSCQNGAALSDLTIHGGMIAIFMDANVTVRGETFTPGPYAKSCAPPWFVTGPAQAIAVDQVTSAGGAGIVHKAPGAVTATNQAITNPACPQGGT
jgi:hypothetical protein